MELKARFDWAPPMVWESPRVDCSNEMAEPKAEMALSAVNRRLDSIEEPLALGAPSAKDRDLDLIAVKAMPDRRPLAR